MVSILSIVDYLTGSEISFSVFYLGPVLYVTWFSGKPAGASIAVISAATWGLVDVAAGASYSSPIIPVWNSIVRLCFFLITLWMLGQMQQAHAEVKILAQTDSLTGLANTRSFYEALNREILRLDRYDSPFTLAYADLDQFKSVNDALGHAAGDELLRKIAHALKSSLRDSDLIARMGGDEFAILMPETDRNAAEFALTRAFESITAIVQAKAGSLPGIGITIGAIVFLTPPESLDAAVSEADKAMYEGKQAGKGTIKLLTYCTKPDAQAAD
jgi:diguanylate cyclase (GGDEF)-like protein